VTEPGKEQPGGKIRVEIDPDIADLVPGFLENRRKDVANLREALAGGDFRTVHLRGHSMKGVGGGYGFDRISEIGAELETCARSEDTDGARRWVDALEEYLDRVEVVNSS
jgi:HPt (histidine-containing phosphotransfer) domain-containing protein